VAAIKTSATAVSPTPMCTGRPATRRPAQLTANGSIPTSDPTSSRADSQDGHGDSRTPTSTAVVPTTTAVATW
jgi:hypothetical protein